MSDYIKKIPKTTTRKDINKNNITTLKHKMLMDIETGEEIETLHIENKNKDINFDKIFIGHIIDAIQEVGNKKIEVLMYLFAVKNSDNQIIKTQTEMAKDTGISRKTISDTLKSLREHNVLKKKSSSVYQLNPNSIFKGTGKKRMDILLTYEQISDEIKETQIDDEPETFVQSEIIDIEEATKQ